jgi:hypothetical protein
MNKTYFHRVSEMTPTRVWINNPTREQAKEAIDDGAIGCTTNPSYISKILSDSVDGEYVRNKIMGLLAAEPDDTSLLVYQLFVSGYCCGRYYNQVGV